MNTRQFAIVFALLSSVCVFALRPTFSQDEDEAESEARKTAERFLQVLERNPRRGTALDKVVEFHLDHESLDELITRMREQAEATDHEDAGRAWLVVGLIEASQGNAEAAQPALERADELLSKSAVASFSLGQNLMTLNRWEDAAAALERAIQRKPAPTDLLDVFQTLGRVLQRLAPGDKVVEVWARLEKLVPDDPRVPLLIAKTLLDDGHWEAALPRFEALAKATKDLYQRSEFELEAVDLRLKLGQFEKALTEADRLLGGLKQDHWLFRETRRRVEEAFLTKDDAAGLIKHYEERLVKQPEDIDAVVRLSRTLVSIDRRKDARTRLEAGIKLAPTSVDLRLELIELLQSDQQFAEAIAQYEQLDRIEPNNPDYIRDWGFVILKQTDEALGEGLPTPPKRPTEGLPEREPAATKAETSGPGERRGQETRAERDRVAAAKQAATIWRKLVDAKPKDASVASQVAGLMASADKSLLGDAAELLRTAIELELEVLSHREQLGEVLDSDGKKEESLAAWRSMAEEPRRNANNLAHLAEVLSRFGYRDETLTTIDAACELDRKSLELRFQQAELRRKWKQHELAMTSLAEAAALADTPETFDRVVQVEVKVLSESEMLDERIEELQAALSRDSGRGALIPKGSQTVAGGRSAAQTPGQVSWQPHPGGMPEAGDNLADHDLTVSGIPSGCEPDSDSLSGGLRDASTPGYFLASLRDESQSIQKSASGKTDLTKFDPASPAAQQFRLAKYLEAADKLREATVAARKAVELAPRNGVFIQAAARMLTLDSQWLSAVELYERLLKIDRRFRIDSLRSIAELEQKLGRKEKALKAGRELLAAAPGNPENAEFVVEVCLRFGQDAEALQILRRASRQNVADKRLALKLVERLMEVGEVRNSEREVRSADGKSATSSNSALRAPNSALDESREVLWRVFEQTAKSDDRIEVIRKLAELSVFPGEFTKLTQRLERYRTDPKLRRDASLALVQVHEQAGDTQQARRELERWLPQAPRDPALLARMVSLCEAAGDLEVAITHQKRLSDVTRKREADEHLVVLLRRAGRDTEADMLASRWLETERDPVKVLREIDRLLTPRQAKNTQDLQLALKLTQSWLDRDPDNWEFLNRYANGLHAIGQTKEADAILKKLLALAVSDDELSVLSAKPKAATSAEERIVARVDQVRHRSRQVGVPYDYGDARRKARGMRQDFRTTSGPNRLTDADRTDPDKSEARAHWDNAVFGHDPFHSRISLLDFAPDDPGAQWLAIDGLRSLRAEVGRPAEHYLALEHYWSELDRHADPLDTKYLDRLVTALDRLQSYDEAMECDRTPLIELVCRELIQAERPDKLKEVLAKFASVAKSPDAIGWLIQRACRDGDVDATLRLLPTYAASFESSSRPLVSAPYAIQPSDPSLVAWWLQKLIWRQVGADLSVVPTDRRVLSDTAKANAKRIVTAAVTVFSDLRVPKTSPNFMSILTDNFQAYSRASLSTAFLSSVPQAGTQGVGQNAGLFFAVAPIHLGRMRLPFPDSFQSSERCVLAVLLQAVVMGGHYTDIRKGELTVGSTEWQSELREHVAGLRKRFEAGSNEARLAELCHTSLLAWQGQSPEAMSSMKQLFENATLQPSLQFDIVSYLLKDNQQELALDLLDRIETNDGQLRKEIEQRAVQLAGKLRRTERLQLAAERLFGMKLEPAEELQLAATLSGLGLHEHAEAIRQRLPQRAGNNLAVLQQAMQERIDAKKIDEACQIAEQIIRRTSPANTLIGSVQQSTFGGGQQARVITTTSTARTKALALLGQQGRLGPLIEQAEQQFDRSPQSLKLFGQLAELYGAESHQHDAPASGRTANEKDHSLARRAGSGEKIAKLLVRLADSEAPDPQFRLTLARALVSAGKAQLAVPHFLFAIERLPNATAQVLFEAEQILSELGHVDELAAIVLKSKLAVNDQQRVELFSRIVQRLEGPPIRAKLIIDLFEKALREAPDFRPMLAARLLAVHSSVWSQEEILPMVRDLAVPPQSLKSPGPWYGIDVARQTTGRNFDSLTRRTVELAASWKRLEELATHVEEARQTHPDWTLGGNVTLGWIRLKQGRLAEARELFGVLQPKRDPLSSIFGPATSQHQVFPLLACGIAADFARANDFESAVAFYELSSDTEMVLEHCRWFGKEPAMQQLAVRIVNRMLAGLDDPAELARQAGSPLFVEAAKITTEINQPYVAARLAQAMITRWQLPNANNSDGGTWLEQLEHRFANSRAAIKPEMLPGVVSYSPLAHLGRGAGSEGQSRTTPDSESPLTPNPSPRRGEGDKAGLRPAIDLLAHVTGDSLTNLRLDSPFVPLIKEAAKDKDLWAKWTAELAREIGRADGREDLSLAILASLTELHGQTSEVSALSRLVEIAKSNLKTERPRTAPAGFHPQLGLWLVARECLGRKEHRELGHELAELATDSASLHFDPRFQWAILRERGELALKSGDKVLASKLWTRLAVDLLRPRSAEETVPMLLGKEFVWSANWPNTRLHRTRDLCRLTLNAEMPDLSLAIFRDTINWPKSAPFLIKFANDRGLTRDPDVISATARLDSNFMAMSGLAEDILATWDTLEPEWRAKGVAAEAILATLLECVLPTSRPDELFVFAVSPNAALGAGLPTPPKRATEGLSERDPATNKSETFGPGQRRGRETRAERNVQSLALRLVDVAVAEKHIDVLTQRLVEREKTVTNPLALRLIHLLLARQSNDEQRLDAELMKLAQHDWSKPALQNSRIAAQIVSLLAPLTKRREQVAKLFEQWIVPISKASPRDEHPLADLRRWLAKDQLGQQQIDKAKETVASHLRHMDQIWSATGAMDGQHLRRLELLAIATDYASAGLTREAIDLLAQVADARWPDRYPDENPGAVLAILEAKLKSRPAQERYELWRTWSLPNDGVKSMRMLTGTVAGKSEISNLKSQISDLKSTAHLLVEAAREADRLAELDAFVEEQMKQRPSDRIHVLLALVHFANKAPAVAEPLVRQQITLWESSGGKTSSATRTRIWDDWLLSVGCSKHESLRELAEQLAKRAAEGARELGDELPEGIKKGTTN